MAEKSEDIKTAEDKISQGKELFARGSRNYLVKAYSDAADDLSQVCNIYEEIYGQLSDELGLPYLMYAKTLIALAEDENKVLSVPEEQNDDDDDDDDDDEDEADGEAEAGESGATNGSDDAVKTADEESNGHQGAEKDKAAAEKANGEASSEAAGPSTTNGTDDKNVADVPVAGTSNGAATEENNEENEDEDDGANLQVAWELLELAVKIFERQGEPALNKLAEAYSELAGISLENSHFDACIADFKKSLEIHMKLPDDNRRIVAEIHYKIGLAHLMQNSFDDCIKELKRASELIDEEIEEEKQKEQEKRNDMIKELEETKQDILAKIAEVEETKTQSIEEVRNELSKIMSTDPNRDSGAGPSSSGVSSSSAGFSGAAANGNGTSSSPSDKPKPTDISHLIKRKKPDTTTADAAAEGSPAKKPAV